MNKTIAWDVDGTLFTAGKVEKPREDVLNLMRAFNALGWKIVVHSGGGVEYAQRRVLELKLDEEMHITIAPKGDPKLEYELAVDDCLDERDWTEDKHGNYINAKYYIIV